MSWIAYSVFVLTFLLAKFTELFTYNLLAYAVSTVLFFYTMYLLNFEINKNSKQSIIISSCFYFIYDIVFSFFIGTNVVAWNVANIFIAKVKQVYDFNIKIYHFTIYGLIFFTTSYLINYFTNEITNTNLLIYQLLLSTIGSVVLILIFIGQKDDVY